MLVLALSTDKMTDNLVKDTQSFTAQHVADGLIWYPRAQQEAKDISAATQNAANPITPSQAAAVIALTSARTKIGSNMASAHFIADHVANDTPIQLTPEILQQYNDAKGTRHTKRCAT